MAMLGPNEPTPIEVEDKAKLIRGMLGAMLPKMVATDVYAFCQVVGTMTVHVPDVDITRCYSSLNYGRDVELGH